MVGRRQGVDIDGRDQSPGGTDGGGGPAVDQSGGQALESAVRAGGDGVVQGADVGDDVAGLEQGPDGGVEEGQTAGHGVDEEAVTGEALDGFHEEGAEQLLAGVLHAAGEAGLLVLEEGVEGLGEAGVGAQVGGVGVGQAREPIEEGGGEGDGPDAVRAVACGGPAGE